jgi:hypothetical protein
MSIVRSEQASGRLEYQSPRLVAYGAVASITGTLPCSHFDKIGSDPDHLTPQNPQLDGDVVCDS